LHPSARALAPAIVVAVLGGAIASVAGPRPIDGWEDIHFGLRPAEILAVLPGGRLSTELCDPRLERSGAVRSGERCERVEAQRFVGYLPFDVAVHFSRATGRAVRIRLVLRDDDQWSRKSYDALLRNLEKVYGPAHVFLPLGAVYEDYCAVQVRRVVLGEAPPTSLLVPPHCQAADAIEGRGGRISIVLCVRETCPRAAGYLPRDAAGVAGARSLEIELIATRAPGEPTS
jgi:hypothetical protein